ncbi:TetR/AcrR family transcriptional regulator [Streptomyces sp. NPDC051561]|uniref:TetR/AcrR family transcriptional regulator n=1 Tax=Streptomyces sp. NPDC051561 TaxID=3365658 RepID=UPI0037AF5B61
MVSAADRVKKPGMSSVWLDAKKPRSAGGGTGTGTGRKADPAVAGLDREKITAATVALLDAEGLAKFSMRRLATELKVTAMSLYWYVATKDDLLELAVDRVMGELDLPDPAAATDWRDQLRQLAQTYREVLVRHPWASILVGRFLGIGPRMMEFSSATLGLMRKTGMPLDRQGGTVASVFQFVYGFATIEGEFHQRAAASGITPDELYAEAMGAISGAVEGTELFRDSTAVMEARGGSTVAEMYDRDFRIALDVLIAGIEATSAASSAE